MEGSKRLQDFLEIYIYITTNSNDVEVLTCFPIFFTHFGAIIVKHMMKFAFNLCCLIHRVFIIIKRKIKNQHWTVGQSTQYGC